MKTLKFPFAVLMATQELIGTNQPFSAHDITKKLRTLVNSGDVEFTDRQVEDVDGVSTYRVEHPEVRDTFEELRTNDLLGVLNRKNAGGYWVYEGTGVASIPAAVCTSAGMAQPITLSGGISKPTDPFTNQVQAYIENQGGVGVTMKQIQSRFKGVSKTCMDYARIVEDLGYTLDKSQPDYASTWAVI